MPESLRRRRSSSESASSTLTATVSTEPPWKPMSRRTRSSLPTMAHQLRQHAVDRIRMDERDLHAVQAASRLAVDQVHPLLVELRQLVADVLDLVRDVVHA